MRVLPPRPDGRLLRRAGLGLAMGAVGGWFAGLLRAPKAPEAPEATQP